MDFEQFKKVFSEVLRKNRQDVDETQESMARDMKVAIKTLCRWDRGESLPRLDQYFQLLDLLGEELHTSLRSKTKEPNRNED